MELGKDFLDKTPEARREIDKWDCVKLRSFCIVKEMLNKEATNRKGENLCKL